MSTATASRVQGIGSGIDDLELRDGKKLAIELDGTITPNPSLVRTMEGASTLAVPIFDPDYRVLRHSLLSSKFDAALDSLDFRYVALSKTGKNLDLEFEDRDVAKLRELLGPKRAFREEVTRAEFVKSLVREGNPSLEFFCPQLHKKQPIETKRQVQKAKDEAKSNRGKGIGDEKNLTVKGGQATPDQRDLGHTALLEAEHLNAPLAVRIAVIEALIVESEMGALSSNILQGTEGKNQGPEHDIHGFLTGEDWTLHGAIPYAKSHPTAKPYEIAQAVQASGAGDASNGAANYGKVEAEARRWVETFEGGELSGSLTVTEPFEFKVGPKETYWAAIQRLAKEVNWRAFVVAGKFYFIDEEELSRGAVRLAIDPDTEGIESVDFEYDTGRPVTEVTVTALVSKWGVPPGAVVTVEGYGPASLGTGDAPPAKKNEPRIGSRVKASTHEGKGRYLVTSIEVALKGEVEDRKATITLKRPTQPLPEPANETTTTSFTGGSSVSLGTAGDKKVEAMLEWAEREAAKARPYAWGGGHDAAFTGPYDCSGGVSADLRVGGFLDAPLATTGLAAWGQAGAGEEITVYVKTSGGAEEEHTAIDIAGNVFESGGGGENTNRNGGWGKVDDSQVKSFLQQFNVKRHPAGF